MTAPDTDIHAVAFFLAEHAVVESGKAYVNGGFWNRLNFPSFPAPAFFSIVAVIEVPWRAYHSKHKFAISIDDADANSLPARFEGEFQVGAAPDMKVGDPTMMPVSINVNGMPFERPGDYSFILRVDGTEIARWGVRVVQVVAPGVPAGRSGDPNSIPPLPE